MAVPSGATAKRLSVCKPRFHSGTALATYDQQPQLAATKCEMFQGIHVGAVTAVRLSAVPTPVLGK